MQKNNYINNILDKYNFILIKQDINHMNNFKFLELIVIDKNLEDISLNKISKFHKEIKNLEEIQKIWPDNGGLQVITAGDSYKFKDIYILKNILLEKINLLITLKNNDLIDTVINIKDIINNKVEIIYKKQIIKLQEIKYFTIKKEENE